jgi:general secretion pathway protein E
MLVGVAAQRLVRRLCPDCRREDVASAADAQLLGGALTPGTKIWRAVGCDACSGDGYRGRAGLYEVVAVDDRFASMIHDGAAEAELEAHARKDNPRLLDDGIAKALAGITTIEEVARVVREEA